MLRPSPPPVTFSTTLGPTTPPRPSSARPSATGNSRWVRERDTERRARRGARRWADTTPPRLAGARWEVVMGLPPLTARGLHRPVSWGRIAGFEPGSRMGSEGRLPALGRQGNALNTDL